MWSMWWPRRWRVDRAGDSGSDPSRSSDDRPSTNRPLSPGPNLVLQAETWRFSPEIARQVVRGHSWKDLDSGWHRSSVALATARSPRHKLAFVMLRAAILDEMETQDPRAFSGWLAERYAGRRRPG